MPIKRTYRKKRTIRKRRFNMTRKMYIRRHAKVNHLITKRFVSTTWYSGSDINPSGGGGKSFSLNDLPASTEFTALFDQYMIAGIQYRFVLYTNPDLVTTATYRGIYPIIKYCHDHDDASAPTSELLVNQYPKMREFVFSPDKNCTRWQYLKPAVANSIYGTLSNGYNARWRQWLDSAYPGTPHYGLKSWVINCYTGQYISLECRYVLKLKSVI